ncbi:MAG: SOS response-associated peptidase family protein, partial [Bacteroidales bacterium]
ITLKENDIIGLAGLYDEWTNSITGELLTTFTIITTPANAMMEIIHNTKKRMPAILSPYAEKDWLRNQISENELISFLKPFDEKQMNAEKVMESGQAIQGSLF